MSGGKHGVGCAGDLDVVLFGLFVVCMEVFPKAFSAGTFLSSKFG